MNIALAHETVFPHTHPHPQMSLFEDIFLTVLFLSIVYAVSRLILGFFGYLGKSRLNK